MTSDKISIKWKLCLYFILFTSLMLAVLWLLQGMFFDRIYGAYSRYRLIKESAVIADNIDSPEINELITALSQENNFSVYIVSRDGTLRTVSERSTTVRFNRASSKMFEYWALAEEAEGVYVTKTEPGAIVSDSGAILQYNPSHFTGNVPKSELYNNLVCARIATSALGEESLIVLISRLEPISSLTGVINVILLAVTFSMLALSVLGAYFVSKGISKPILRLSASAEKLAKGDYGVVFEGGGCREITQLSDTLNSTARELSKLENLRREFIANISHDLRTPLTMIGGYGEMMRDIPGENNEENIQVIIDETKRLTKLVNDTLDLSKLQSGSYSLRPTVFCITEDVLDIVSQFEKLSAGRASLRFEGSGDLLVEADESLVSEAVYNLVNNAVAHSGEGVSVLVRQTVSDGKVRISVIDNGPGIPPADLEGIWERYRKGSGSGTGLGLAIVRAAMTLNGGSCGVQSAVGKGSEFWIELPLYEKPGLLKK